MRTILLTFSPNMTLINEAMRFHHTFNNLDWEPPRDPGTNHFLHSSSLSSHLTCLPASLSNQNLWGACTFEQCSLNGALHVFMFYFLRKARRGPWGAWKRVQTIPREANRHQMLLFTIDRQVVVGRRSRQPPAPQPPALGGWDGLWVCEPAPPEP